MVLDTAEAIKFEFLGLNPLDPPLKRLDNKAAEDAFCQRLSPFDAKWSHSEARYFVISEFEASAAGNQRVDSAFVMDK
jgi:hypothetical protein